MFSSDFRPSKTVNRSQNSGPFQNFAALCRAIISWPSARPQRTVIAEYDFRELEITLGLELCVDLCFSTVKMHREKKLILQSFSFEF